MESHQLKIDDNYLQIIFFQFNKLGKWGWFIMQNGPISSDISPYLSFF